MTLYLTTYGLQEGTVGHLREGETKRTRCGRAWIATTEYADPYTVCGVCSAKDKGEF